MDANHLPERHVEYVVTGQATSDGAGVKLTRLLDQRLQERLDPFLMLDRFATDDADDYIAGFPDHPHRGFETITIMHAGRMRHRDSAGHEGLLQPGDVQWMVTGRGLVHSEMPEQQDGRMAGFQLWLNTPAADKLAPPQYRDIPAGTIPVARPEGGATVRVIAGACAGVAGAVQRPATEPLLLDVTLPAGSELVQAIPAGHCAFVVPHAGTVDVGGKPVPATRLAILEDAEGEAFVRLRPAEGTGEASVLLVAGRPLHEPIVQYGPFVMNEPDEIRQAIADYQAGRFHAQAW